MVGRAGDQTVRQRVKESANWRCQNPDCQRECLRPGETFAELLARQRPEPQPEGQLELDWCSRADAVQPYIMKAMPDGYGGYLALCGSCAIQFIQPSPPPRFQQTKWELLGQLRLL